MTQLLSVLQRYALRGARPHEVAMGRCTARSVQRLTVMGTRDQEEERDGIRMEKSRLNTPRDGDESVITDELRSVLAAKEGEQGEFNRTIAPKSIPTPIATAMALAQTLDTSSGAIARRLSVRPDWMPDAAIAGGLTQDELVSAKECLIELKDRVETECAIDESQTPHQVNRRRQKALTRQLDRLLSSLQRKQRFKDIEGIAFLWDDVFPQFATNAKHWTVICEHYARALNKQQRFPEVVEKLFTTVLEKSADPDHPATLSEHMLLSPTILEAVFLACGHLKDSDNAIKLLGIARERNMRLHKVAYFHLINTLLKDDPAGHFDLIVTLCDEIVTDLKDSIPFSFVPSILTVAAERGELHLVMPFYQFPADARMNSFIEFRFEICLQALWKMRYIDDMMVIIQDVMDADATTNAMKARVCKFFLRKSLGDRKEYGERAMQVTYRVLELMEAHRIRTNHRCIPLLLGALIEDEHMNTLDAFLAFFDQYPHVFQWNSFTVCELIMEAVRSNEAALVDELLVLALDQNISIKYVALESVVAFYYRSGMLESFEKASDIIRALRFNKHIPLGIAITEIGMTCNLQLQRYEEVIHLFEDFSKLDGERKRVLWRKPILQKAKTAYSKLKRYDEANAMRQLLSEHHEKDSAKDGANRDDTSDDMGDDEEEHFADREEVQRLDDDLRNTHNDHSDERSPSGEEYR